jgi:YVTN family beta-propeller protein
MTALTVSFSGDITIIKSKSHFLLALSLGLTIIISLVILTCNNVIAQTLKTITEKQNAVEKNPQMVVGIPPFLGGCFSTSLPFFPSCDSIAVNELTNKIYIMNLQSGIVSVIDSNSGSAVKNIRVGTKPSSLVVDGFNNRIYVGNQGSHTVSLIDGYNDSKISSILIGGPISIPSSPIINPYLPLAVDNINNRIYVPKELNNSVSVIDGSNNKKEPHDIAVGAHPGNIAVNPVNAKIYVLNSANNTVSVIDGTNDKKEPHDIAVGEFPSNIAVNPFNGKIYVLNSGNNTSRNITVSVINGTNDKKEPHDIAVGDNPNVIAAGQMRPTNIAINPSEDKIYVVNSGRNSVSVINGTNDKKEPHDIAVGDMPTNIAVNAVTNMIYVVNSGNNTVSVINGTNDKKEPHDIAVGDIPTMIAVNALTNMIYVANEKSNTVSVIDGFSHKVAAGITFNIRPGNSGTIICDKKVYPTNIYLYVDAGTKCTPQSNKDFQFSGWVENLKGNSTIPLNISANSTKSTSLLNSFLSTIGIIKPNGTSTLTVNRYGTFTANFKSLPPPIPPEFLYLLVGIILSSLFGWSIPSIMGWVKAKTQRKYLKECIYQIGKLDRNAVEEVITGYYVDGKISESHRQLLKDKISEYYENVKGS